MLRISFFLRGDIFVCRLSPVTQSVPTTWLKLRCTPICALCPVFGGFKTSLKQHLDSKQHIMTVVWDEKNGVWSGDKAVQHQSFKLPSPLWIFGYGSLCWKAGDIKFAEKRIAVLKGWKRRFYQRS